MRTNILNLLKHPFVTGSLVMLVGTNLANLFSYFYHLLSGRLLGPALYGELVAVISLLGLVTTTYTFIGLTIVKFVSAANEKEKRTLFQWFSKKALYFGVILSSVILLLSPLISSYLNLDIRQVIVIVPIFVLSVIIFFYKSFLQGAMKFMELVLINNIEMFIRLATGILLIAAGLSVFGALAGILIASIFSFMFGKFILREYKIGDVVKNINLGSQVFKYSIPVLIVTLSGNALISTDIILVKHFFNSYEAGIFSSTATLAKIIFYGVTPIMGVMFPLVSKRVKQGYGYIKIVALSMAIVLVMISAMLSVYYLYPDLLVRLLYGKLYVEASKYLFKYAVFISIYSLIMVLSNYFLSREKTYIVNFVLFAAFIQAIGIYVYHKDIVTVISVSIITSFILLFILLIYLIKDIKGSIYEGRIKK